MNIGWDPLKIHGGDVQFGPDRSKIQGVDPEQTNKQTEGKLKL